VDAIPSTRVLSANFIKECRLAKRPLRASKPKNQKELLKGWNEIVNSLGYAVAVAQSLCYIRRGVYDGNDEPDRQ
jgi:hypothetical protein